MVCGAFLEILMRCVVLEVADVNIMLRKFTWYHTWKGHESNIENACFG